MKLRIKAAAAAALLATSGFAAAAVSDGADNNGELWLLAYDTTSQLTYTFDTGLLFNSFTPTAATSQSFTLDGFSNFIAAATASTVQWGVYASDRLAPTQLYSTARGTPVSNPNLLRINNINGNLSSVLAIHNFAGTHATQTNGSALVPATGAAVDFGYGGYVVGPNSNFNSNASFLVTGTLGDSLNFFRFSNGNPAGSTRTQFVNALGVASTFTLNAGAGTLNFNVAPVPEPSTYAMMLAGLMTLGAVVRRRRNGK